MTFNVKNFIDDYFEHPIVQKIGYNNTKSLYVCKVPSYIHNEHKFILYEVTFDANPIGHTEKVSKMHWCKVQTLKVKENKFPKLHKDHVYSVDLDNSEFDLSIVSRSEKETMYRINNIFNDINVLITSESAYDNPSYLTLTSALEMYNTTVSLNF